MRRGEERKRRGEGRKIMWRRREEEEDKEWRGWEKKKEWSREIGMGRRDRMEDGRESEEGRREREEGRRERE